MQLESLVSISRKLMAANVTNAGMRQTTGSPDPDERLWVYQRTGQPCRQCGAPILSRKQGIDARTSFWCPVCQPI
jgi:endonuclease-8